MKRYETTTRCYFEILLFSWKSHTKHVGEPHFSHHCPYTVERFRWFNTRWFQSLNLTIPSRLERFLAEQNLFFRLLWNVSVSCDRSASDVFSIRPLLCSLSTTRAVKLLLRRSTAKLVARIMMSDSSRKTAVRSNALLICTYVTCHVN